MNSRFFIVFADILLPLLLGMVLRRWGLSREILRMVIRANVVVIATFLSLVSFWSVHVTKELLWLPISIIPICFIPVLIFYGIQKNRFHNPLDQGSYMISMMLGNIGTLAGLCAYVLFGEKGFAYVQLIAVPQILVIVLFCFPMAQRFYEMGTGSGDKGEKTNFLRLLLTPNQLPALGVAAGLFLSGLHVERPEAVGTLFTVLIHVSAWMGMMPVGYDLRLGSVGTYALKLWPIFPVKFILLPAILYGLTILFVKDPAMITCVVLSAGAPTAIFAVAASQLYGLNVDMAESSFVTTTLTFLFVLYPLVYWWVGM
ncbi:AEC family transporter [uncultured Dialister sp.]|uniref:AEC family transporter n=1 Tax=uncultured Dialister sp. TaxID=278064 RepID=UPI00260D9B0A|nr:hypothetical protein [uncultured Dialister sp.]